MKAIIPTPLLATLCVVLTAIAQVALKQGLSDPRVHQAMQGHQWSALFWHLGLSAPMMTGVTLYVVATLLWFYALMLADVSYLYPFLGLGFVITTASAALYLGESVSLLRWAGVLLIVAGVLVVSRS